GKGERVEALLVEEAVEVEKEFYLGVVLDRSRGRFVLLGIPQGGVEVEEVAERSPQLIVREEIDPLLGLQPFQVRRMAFRMGLSPEVLGLWRDLLNGMWRAVSEKEMLLCEINPLALTKRWTFVALDAKVELDDNALRRHPELKGLVSASEDPLEEWAERYGLNYIKLRGNVGCLVNGAGLAMATMDLVKLAGGEPANFLDVGGGATVEMVKEGLKILHADPDVKVIFVNIFGGILRCDTLARGMIEASKEVDFDRPIVVRMEGTNVEEGRRILASSGLKLTTAQEMDEAARKITEILKEG
ncbi:TPA: ADP-forming succinate--CoA ligase subunit beta, partial [Candidatus Bipolaricaulota bacterium]|nr:ADP-forming succinate--CoA ligase subunit beta [Candidatus Bipolaricaulota bacterium]